MVRITFIISQYNYCSYIHAVASFLELLPYLMSIHGVTCFLSEKITQDPLEKFFGCQRQKGRSYENPTVADFLKNTQSLRVINSLGLDCVTNGNCRGTKRKVYDLEAACLNEPLQKRKRNRRHSK